MDMIRVHSTAIRAIGYDPETSKMKIAFITSGTYTYCRVPPTLFEAFLKASSKGIFYKKHIAKRYQCF